MIVNLNISDMFRSYSSSHQRVNGRIPSADVQLHQTNNHQYHQAHGGHSALGGGGRVHGLQLPIPPPPPQYQTISKPSLGLASGPIPGINKDVAQVGAVFSIEVVQ